MKETGSTPTRLIAPCGINCSICLAFLRQKNHCDGCLALGSQQMQYCRVCRIKNCLHLADTQSGFCYECPTYPCQRIKQLDKRYRLRYHVSNIDNHRVIRETGLEAFMKLEKEKWKCPDCGGTICVHRGYCLDCNSRN